MFLSLADRSSFYKTGRDLSEHPAQQLDNHMGKVLRLNLDGSVPADNPFVGRSGALPEIYTYGHRDPQGLAYRPETGELWSVEHGPVGGDELNLLRAGRNYGWPIVSKGANHVDTTGFHSIPSRADMEEPRFVWPTAIAPSNIVFYSGKRFPAWRGNALISSLVGQRLVRVEFNGSEAVSASTLLEGRGRIRDVHEGSDGSIYLAIAGGEGAKSPILRLEPTE